MARTNGRLNIDIETKQFYSKIKNKYSSLRLTNSQLFSLALTMGYYKGIKKPLNKKMGFIRHETIPTDLFSVIMLVCMDEYGVNDDEWIDNPLILLDLAEEYANAGIRMLMELMDNYDSTLDEFLSLTILELYNDIDFELLHEKFLSK